MLIIGGYTERMDENTPGKARGISVYDFFPSDGRIQFLGFAPAINPSYLITDQKRSIVYAVHEKDANSGAAVTAHKVNRNQRGKVSFEQISNVALPGDGPCHLSFAGDTVLVSSYSSGHLHVISRGEDGSLGEILQNIKLEPQNTGRTSHAHCAVYFQEREAVLLCDKGDDQLKVFSRAENGTLTERPELALSFPEGEGPRHIALHPKSLLAVVNGECVGHVHLIDLSGDKPLRANVANYLPERVLDEATGAAIKLSGNGKMIYASDRTYSIITALRIDERDKKMVVRDTFPSGGESPRDLSLSPKGEWLLSANTADHTIGVFRVGPRGELVHYHTFKKVPSPSCLAWL